jgi:hypothetical protein
VYPMLLMAHSLLRWLVLSAVAVRVAVGWHGVATGREPGGPDRRASLVAMILTDLQLTLGLLLWAVFSPVVSQARGDIGAAMKDGALRWPLVEHPTLMIVAVGLVHVAHVLTKRASAPAQLRAPAAVSTIALLALLAGSFRHG